MLKFDNISFKKFNTSNSWYLCHGIRHKKKFCPFKLFTFIISLTLQGNVEKSYSSLEEKINGLADSNCLENSFTGA